MVQTDTTTAIIRASNYGTLATNGTSGTMAVGVAGVSAMSNIPQVDQNKTFALGIGVGHYDGNTALAFGGSYCLAPNAVMKASVATTSERSALDKDNTVYGFGAAISWLI